MTSIGPPTCASRALEVSSDDWPEPERPEIRRADKFAVHAFDVAAGKDERLAVERRNLGERLL